jgi:hypothetical protein
MDAFRAKQLVRDRQAEIVAALCRSAIPVALSGSNATFAWISNVDPSAARQYRNIEFLVTRDDAESAILALMPVGLIAEVYADYILFRNGKTRHDRWADKALFFVGKDGRCKVPSPDEIEWLDGLPLVEKNRLVYLQLERWTLDDRVDIRDLIDVGIVDDTWPQRFPADLASRLQELIDDPDG